MTQYVTVFASRFRRYARLLLAVIVDSIWRFRYSAALVIGAGLGGLAAQIAALAVAATYAHSLEKGKVITALGREFDPRTSIVLMAGCASLVLAALLVSGCLAYVSGRQSIRLRRKCQQYCTKRAVQRLAGDVFVWPPPDGRQLETGTITRIVRGDAAFNGWVARLLAEAIVPAFTCILALGTLLYLELLSTLVILAVMAVSVLFYYHVNLGAAHCSKQMEERAIVAGREMRTLIGAMRSASVVTGAHHERIDAAFLPDGVVPSHLDARDGRMLAMQKSKLVSNSFLAVCMFVVILTLGIAMIRDGRGWGRLLVYIVALRHGLVNFRAVSATLTSVTRFYPQLRRYRAFLEVSAPRADDQGESRDAYALRARKPTLEGSERRIALEPGARIALICPTPLDRYTAGFLLETLLAPDADAVGSALGSLRLALPLSDAAPEQAFADVAGLPAETTRNDIASMLNGAGAPMIEQLPADFSRPLDAEAWSDMSNKTRALIGWIGAVASKRPWIMGDHETLHVLPEEVRRRVLSALADRFLVIVSSDGQAVDEHGASVVAVADEGKILGCGSPEWFDGHVEAVAAMLSEIRGGAAGGGGPGELDDDEELM